MWGGQKNFCSFPSRNYTPTFTNVVPLFVLVASLYTRLNSNACENVYRLDTNAGLPPIWFQREKAKSLDSRASMPVRRSAGDGRRRPCDSCSDDASASTSAACVPQR